MPYINVKFLGNSRPLELLMSYKVVLQKGMIEEQETKDLDYLQSLIHQSKTVINAFEQISKLEKELNLKKKNITLTDKHLVDFKWLKDKEYLNLDKLHKIQGILLNDKFLLTTLEHSLYINNEKQHTNTHDIELITICHDLNLLTMVPLKSRAGDPYGNSLLITIKGSLAIKLMANNAETKWNFVNKFNELKPQNSREVERTYSNNEESDTNSEDNNLSNEDKSYYNDTMNLIRKTSASYKHVKEEMELCQINKIPIKGNFTNNDNAFNCLNRLSMTSPGLTSDEYDIKSPSSYLENKEPINLKYLPSLPSSQTTTTDSSTDHSSQASLNYVMQAKPGFKVKAMSALSLSYIKTNQSSKEDVTSDQSTQSDITTSSNLISSRSSSTINTDLNGVKSSKLGISKYLSTPCGLYAYYDYEWKLLDQSIIELRELNKQANKCIVIFTTLKEQKQIIKIASLANDKLNILRLSEVEVEFYLPNKEARYKVVMSNPQEAEELINILFMEQEFIKLNNKICSPLLELDEIEYEHDLVKEHYFNKESREITCLANLSFKLFQLRLVDHTWFKIGKCQLEVYKENNNIRLIVKNNKKGKENDILLSLNQSDIKVERLKAKKLILYILNKHHNSSTFLLDFKSKEVTESLAHWLIS
ncbi:hypothetical protein K502DRAFT_339362 [Neoconidiobolus thromboides FSU 785]|nr:hypothetical protein K502DRAFT_339362 [Neoconidiobolus thromboides FSU 785]